jgi:hypothetical protein
MSSAKDELKEIVNVSMPFPAKVIKAYYRLGAVFTSGDLSREAGIPSSTAKFFVKKMVKLRMISKIPHRKKYQKYANASSFSDWLNDLLKLAVRPLERES